MNDINKRIYRTALENLTSKMKNPRKIREFYWDLIKSKGYTVEKKEVIPVEQSTPNQEYSFSEFSEFDYEFEEEWDADDFEELEEGNEDEFVEEDPDEPATTSAPEPVAKARSSVSRNAW
jgi:hypothetical protein